MTDFKKWFAARARNPDKITLEEAFAAGARSQPAPSFADAYQGAMEEVAIWKRRALEAETLNRKFIAKINGPMHMGEPAHPAPSLASDDVSLISEGKTQPAQSVKDAIIDDLQSQFDTEGITEHDSGDALIRLSDAIAAVEDNFAQPAPSICPAALSPIINWLRNGCDPRKAADELEMLAAAPEAKP